MEGTVGLGMTLQGGDLRRIDKLLDHLTELHVSKTSDFTSRMRTLESLYTCVYPYIPKKEIRDELDKKFLTLAQELSKQKKGVANTTFVSQATIIERELKLQIHLNINKKDEGGY